MDAAGVGQAPAAEVTVVSRPARIFPVFPFYPPYPPTQYPYPYAFPAPFPATMAFTFQVMAEQPVATHTRTLNSWAEALAHAQTLFAGTPGATRVIVTDSRGTQQVVPGAYAPPFPPAYPYAPGPLVVGRRRFGIFTVAGPYAHLGESDSGTVGQRPVEAANGAQRLVQDARNYAVGVLAGMYAAQGLEPAAPEPAIATAGVSGMTFYTADAWRTRFPGVDLPPAGLSAPAGSVVVINVDDLLNFGQGQQQTIRVVTASPAQAAAIATSGSAWALLESAPIPAMPERRGLSPAVVAGIAAVAVAALLLLA